MKTTEIQIGSWVSYNNKAQQVLEISDIDNEVYLSAAGVVDITEVNPITLKKVHLTHNGFKATNAEDTEFVYRDGYEVKVMIDEYIRDSMFLSIEFAEKNIWMPIEYVHELQQAMCIMGCDKEIELSKQKSCDSCDHYTSFHGCMVHGYFLNKCIDSNYRDYKEDKVKYSKGIEL